MPGDGRLELKGRLWGLWGSERGENDAGLGPPVPPPSPQPLLRRPRTAPAPAPPPARAAASSFPAVAKAA